MGTQKRKIARKAERKAAWRANSGLVNASQRDALEDKYRRRIAKRLAKGGDQ